MNDALLDELHRLTVDVAREAAAYVCASRPEGRVDVAATKSSPTDVVTEVDRATEKLIRERILAVRPEDAFLGEEGGVTGGSSGVTWVVDPIDGTVNFMYGLPSYSVSIAAAYGPGVDADRLVPDHTVTGCVVNIATGEEFSAVRGQGAFRRDDAGSEPERVKAIAPSELAYALVGTGFNYVLEIRRTQAAAVAKLLESVRDVRRMGSAAIDLCSVACGRLDAFVEQGLHPWDLAAGGLVAQESGVRLGGLDGTPNERLTIAAPEEISTELFELVRHCGF